MATLNTPEDIKNEFNDVWKGINKLIDRVNKLENNNITLEARVKPATCEHNFQIAKHNYYKLNCAPHAFGRIYDLSRTYSTLFCTKCGETKEIITS